MLRDAHLVVTAAMAGIIWFVQVVHYPLLQRTRPGYMEAHARLTGSIVGPLMVLELALQTALLFKNLTVITVVASLLLLAIWLSTFAVQVPLHTRLQQVFDEQLSSRLTRTNWIRTAAWTIRLALATQM